MSTRILLVDDDARLTWIYSRVLKRAGFHVVSAPGLEEARAELREQAFDVVLLDLYLGNGLGPDLLPDLCSQDPRPAVALLSATLDAGKIGGGVEGIDIAAEKPVAGETLVELIKELEQARAAS